MTLSNGVSVSKVARHGQLPFMIKDLSCHDDLRTSISSSGGKWRSLCFMDPAVVPKVLAELPLQLHICNYAIAYCICATMPTPPQLHMPNWSLLGYLAGANVMQGVVFLCWTAALPLQHVRSVYGR